VTAPSAWPTGTAKLHFETIDSTNAEARRRAASGQREPVWIAADTQTAGRGRRGRAWISPKGNVAATLLIAPGKPVAECAQLSFVAALAASDALARLAPGIDFTVKWPNDVLANGGKIAGILLESASSGGKPEWLAVGIGINLAAHPPDAEFPATSLMAQGAAPPAPDAALTELAAAFAKWYEVWAARGFSPIRDAWLARAAFLGRRIRARLEHEEISGVFEGIDVTGALILREAADRVRRISAGEVFF